MIKKIDFGGRTHGVKLFLFGFFLGAVLMGLVLDKRYQALITAFQYPQIVNSSEFKAEIEKK